MNWAHICHWDASAWVRPNKYLIIQRRKFATNTKNSHDLIPFCWAAAEHFLLHARIIRALLNMLGMPTTTTPPASMHAAIAASSGCSSIQSYKGTIEPGACRTPGECSNAAGWIKHSDFSTCVCMLTNFPPLMLMLSDADTNPQRAKKRKKRPRHFQSFKRFCHYED